MKPSRLPCVPLLLLILGTASGPAVATVPCFGGDEPYTAENLPATDLETGLPCRLPTAEELARRSEAWGGSSASSGNAAYPPSDAPAAAPYSPPASGWAGQSTAASNNGYGAAGGAYGGSQGYGGGPGAGGVQGGSFKRRGQAQGGSPTNPYASGKTFSKRPKNAVDASTFGGGNNGSAGGSSWPDAGYETPAPYPY